MKMLKRINTINRKQMVLGIALLEIICTVICGVIAYTGYSKCEVIDFTEDDMQLLTLDGEVRSGNYSDTSFSDVKAVVTPAFKLPEGIYYIQVSYNGCGIINGGLIYDQPRNGKELFEHDEFYIRSEQQDTSFRVKIYEDSAVRFKLRLTGDAVDGDYIQLKEVHIIPSKLTCVYCVFYLVAIFFMIDLLIWGYVRYYKSWNQKQKMIFIMLSFTIFMVGLPIYQEGLIPASDLVFHLQRIEGVYQGLLSGQFPVRIDPGWLDGHGYASSIFYGDIFLYFPAILRMVGFTVDSAYKFYLFAVNIVTVLVAYYSFNKMTKDEIAAAAGSILYAGSLYRLDCLYYAKIGRCSAMMFYPLIIAGFYLLFTEEIDSKEYKRIWSYLTLGFTGLLMTHMLSGLMVAIYAVLVCLIMIRRVLRKNTLLELIKAVTGFVLLNLWYLVPFVQYMFSEKMHINAGLTSNIKAGKDYYALLEDFTQEGKTFYQLFIDNNTVGYAIVLIVLCYLITIPLQKREDILTKHSRFFLGLTCFATWVCMTSFPAVKLAKISDVILKYFKTTQYQFRFMSVAIAFAAALGAIFIAMKIFGNRGSWIAVGILLGITMCQDCAYFKTTVAQEVYLDEADLNFRLGKSVDNYDVGNAEYLPVTVDRHNLVNTVQAEEGLNYEVIDHKYLSYKVNVVNSTEQDKNLTLPVIYYTGYQATDLQNGTKMQTYAGDNGSVTVSIPGNYSGDFEMKYHVSWYWRMAEIISFITLIFIITYCKSSDGVIPWKHRNGLGKVMNKKL